MKLYLHKDIPKSEDWRTDTDNNMINAFREIMANNNQYVDDPYVGIFWYDSEDKDVFGVYSILAEDAKYYQLDVFNARAKTCERMHYAVWQKGVNKGKDPRFKVDYTSVPRGRVFEVENRGFVVCVGHWINDYPEAKQAIIEEFQLPDNTEFEIDSHWDLGRGWSDKHF